MKTILFLILGILCILLCLLFIAVIKTLLTKPKVSNFIPVRNQEREDKYATKLSKMVQYETVSIPDENQRDLFLGFHKVLDELFPLVHEHLDKMEIDGNLLFHWKGENHDKPIVLMAHQDVVPAEGEWQHGHFSGDYEDGKIWGRGSADTKCTLMAFLQAIEELLESGYTPSQDIYVSSSCTEEVGGDGCPKIVEYLKNNGVKPWLVCDEGGAIVDEPIGGIKGYYAMIGVLEKGQGNLLVKAKSNGGHSSYPPKNSPIARLAKFITQLEKHDPMKIQFGKEVEAMFSTISSYGPFHYRLLFGNLWLFKPLLKLLLPVISPQACALLKTTIAFTMQSGSDGRNVIPQEATLNINLRYIPHQGMKESNQIIKDIAKKYDLEVEEVDCYDYLPPVNIHSDAYHYVEKTINKVFEGLPTCPYVMTGGTDARFYQDICDACIRFGPVFYNKAQMSGMHGLNEYLDAYSLVGAVDFYKTIIQDAKDL